MIIGRNWLDPTDSNTNQVDSVSSNAGSGGSTWPLLATLFMADQNVPVAFIPASLSGTNITEWQRNNSNHGDRTTLYGSMYRRINAVGGIKAVLYWQGERDAVLGTSQADYKNLLTTFADNAQEDFGIKVIAAMIGNRDDASNSGFNNVRLAELSAWNDNGNVLPGPAFYDVNLYSFGSYPNSSKDGTHFKTDDDIQIAANRWWAAISADFYGGSEGRGPQVGTIESNTEKNKIAVTFSGDNLPLLPASNLGGFTVYDNGVSLTISNINRVASNQLLITLESAATGTLTLSLQTWSATYATWPINIPTDSSTYNLPAEIFVGSSVSLASSPVISNVSSTVALTTATISWTTDKNASTQVQYGVASSYGDSTNESATTTMATTHSDFLSNLSTCTTYNYRVVSNDAVGNQAISSNGTFTTIGCPVSVPASYPTVSLGASIIESPTEVVLPAQSLNFDSDAISQLQKTLISLINQLKKLIAQKLIFAKTLAVYSVGDDVKLLQVYLITSNTGLASQQLSKYGATGIFGKITQNALIEFQKANSIIPSYGIFGPKTKEFINR